MKQLEWLEAYLTAFCFAYVAAYTAVRVLRRFAEKESEP